MRGRFAGLLLGVAVLFGSSTIVPVRTPLDAPAMPNAIPGHRNSSTGSHKYGKTTGPAAKRNEKRRRRVTRRAR